MNQDMITYYYITLLYKNTQINTFIKMCCSILKWEFFLIKRINQRRFRICYLVPNIQSLPRDEYLFWFFYKLINYLDQFWVHIEKKKKQHQE